MKVVIEKEKKQQHTILHPITPVLEEKKYNFGEFALQSAQLITTLTLQFSTSSVANVKKTI
jgi:hypothetical protein